MPTLELTQGHTNLHWQLNVAFKVDLQRVRAGNEADTGHPAETGLVGTPNKPRTRRGI